MTFLNRLLGLVLAFTAGLLFWQQAQLRRDINDLRQVLSALQLTAQTAQAPHPRSHSGDSIDIQRQLARLRDEVALAVARPGADQNPAPEYGVQLHAIDPQRSFSPVIDNTLALGVLDARAWEDMEADVARMSKEENRAFWIQVFDGIERGELQVVPPEEDLPQ